MSEVLIEQLYSPEQCQAIKRLYKQDSSTHRLIRDAIGTKLITEDKVITSKPIDVVCLMCLTSKFASSDDECHRVAITVYQYYDKPNNLLPSITEDFGLEFAYKTLIALSFQAKAMEKRWKYHGAPSPKYYRQASKVTFCKYGQDDIAAHHEQWEGFLGELFI